MQVLDLVEPLGWEDFMRSALASLIKTAIGAISRLHYTNYSMILSPDDRLAIKNRITCWVFKGEFDNVTGNGERGRRSTMIIYGGKFHREEVTLWGLHINRAK
jgi:hypothetical protein